jgi:hypothetical protein
MRAKWGSRKVGRWRRVGRWRVSRLSPGRVESGGRRARALRYTVGMKVADLTVEELKQIIRDVVDQALWEHEHDPDRGLEIRPEYEELIREALENPGELVPLEEVMAQRRAAV